MAKSPEEAMASMVASLEQKTGKGLDAWIQAVKKSGKPKHGEIVAWLKDQGVTHGYANLIAHRTLGSDSISKAEGGTDLVGSQYAGKKAGLKPLYDALVAKVQGLGPDVELSPKNTYVSLRRKTQFGLIQPSTADRLDVGLKLKAVAPKGRLEASGSFNAMCSHRVRVLGPKDIDRELLGWLKQAYDQA